MPDAKALLAIETGGSRGRAALVLDGEITERTLEEGLNPNDIGTDLFEKRLRDLCLPLISPLRTPGRKNPSLDAVAGIAGAGDPEMLEHCRRALTPILKPYGSRLRLKAMTDVGALAWACIGDGSGIVLIAGTGSICMGFGRRGGLRETWRAGGKGMYIDRGSGATMGLFFLSAARATVEGDLEHELLVKLICDRYGIEPEEIRTHFPPDDRQKVAELARMAFEARTLGDTFSRNLIRSSARGLVELVEEVKASGGLRRGMKVFASGGLFNSPVMRRAFGARLESRIPGTRLVFIEDSLKMILGALMKRGAGRK